MRKYLVLLLFVVLGFDSWIYAQEAEAAFKRANQQYVLFESERDKGDNPNQGAYGNDRNCAGNDRQCHPFPVFLIFFHQVYHVSLRFFLIVC